MNSFPNDDQQPVDPFPSGETIVEVEPVEHVDEVDHAEEACCEADGTCCAGSAKLIAKKPTDGTDGVFEFESPAVVGRFDISVGPIAIDLGGLPDGGYVSRKHAEFTLDDGQWYIEDLNSSNGTFILRDGNWQRVSGAEPLKNGDSIAFGNAQLTFECCCADSSCDEATE